ncbi:hypothetical protein N7493_007841 [Penicillium malachiteum]|uniref:NAD-dependent epimerase/dehydratase domain-containing protein n=1 Tax=Penicillium malachiteum TaxID=1324776 RepID=A0AAD6HJ02_9EURO|nr:hypothetical protein N7493_007841 [Penicillium malachiteum]
MRVLVLGGTGKLGSRLPSALIAREHHVFAFVRTPSKLARGIQDKLAGIERGDAKKSSDIEAAIVRNQCDAVVNSAGYAAMAPWGKRDLPAIVDAVTCAAL